MRPCKYRRVFRRIVSVSDSALEFSSPESPILVNKLFPSVHKALLRAFFCVGHGIFLSGGLEGGKKKKGFFL